MIAKIIAAFALGLVGSFHCAGMCGPLVIAGTLRGGRMCLRRLGGYLLGRLVSYAFVGAVFGQLGAHALHRLPLEVGQTALALLMGVFAGWTGVRLLLRTTSRGSAAVTGGLRRDRVASLLSWVAQWVPGRGLGLGLATGFLPCGLLVPAWLLAASTEEPGRGALVMAAFFMATAPGLLAPAVAFRFARRSWTQVPVWAQGAAWLVLAAWIAVRPFVASGHHH